MPASLRDNNLLDCSNIVEINEIIACEQALSPKALWQQGEKPPVPPGTPGELPYRLMTSKYGYPRSKQEAGISLKANIKVLLHDSVFWFCIFLSCQ